MSAAYTPLFPLPQLSARDAYNKAEHYDSQYNKDAKYLQYNYWGKIYKNLHPTHTQAGTLERTRCLNVLKQSLQWHRGGILLQGHYDCHWSCHCRQPRCRAKRSDHFLPAKIRNCHGWHGCE